LFLKLLPKVIYLKIIAGKKFDLKAAMDREALVVGIDRYPLLTEECPVSLDRCGRCRGDRATARNLRELQSAAFACLSGRTMASRSES
jgi:hypothetical protein